VVCSVVAFLWGVVIIATDHSPFVPYGDGALIEIAIRHAMSFHRTTGPYSRFGWDHPGPLFFYLQAPLCFLWRDAHALCVAALTINSGAAAGTVALIRRQVGKEAGLWSAVIASVLVLQLGVPQMANGWGPNVIVFPTLLFVCAVSLSRGSLAITLLATGTGAFIAQTHVGTVPFVVVGTAISLGLNVFRTPRQDAIRYAGAGAILLALLWSPPIAQEIASSPGNLTAILRFAKSNSQVHGWTEVAERAAQTLWRPNYEHNLPADLTGTAVGLAAFLIIAASAFALGLKRKFVPSVLLSILCLIGFGTELLGAHRATGPLEPYIWQWAAALPAGALLGLLLPIAKRTYPVALIAAPVAAGYIAIWSATTPITGWITVRNSEILDEVSLVRQSLAPNRIVDLKFAGDSKSWSRGASLANELERRGISVHVPNLYASMFDLPPMHGGDNGLHVQTGPIADTSTLTPSIQFYLRGDHYLAVGR